MDIGQVLHFAFIAELQKHLSLTTYELGPINLICLVITVLFLYDLWDQLICNFTATFKPLVR